jgi:hypothetical protein
MDGRRRTVSMASILIALASASTMAETPAVPTATTADCELYVFPTLNIASQTQGLVNPLGNLGHRTTDATNASALANVLDIDSQYRTIDAVDLPSRLGIKPSKIIRGAPQHLRNGFFYYNHYVDEPKGRQSSSSAACYYELYVGFIFNYKSPLANYLQVNFMLFDYGNQPKRASVTKTVQVPLKLFPPKAGDNMLAANDEVLAAFTTLLNKFTSTSHAKFSRTATSN